MSLSLPRFFPFLRSAAAGVLVFLSGGLFSVPVARALPGDFDLSFNGTGFKSVSLAENAVIKRTAVQSDGRIICAGWMTLSPTSLDTAIHRLLPDGSPDLSFNGTGRLTFDTSAFTETLEVVAIQPDGRILAAGGTSPTASSSALLLVRCTPQGTPDTAFGNGTGFTVTSMANPIPYGIAPQQNGGFLVRLDGRLARFLPDGSLDLTFGSGGIVQGLNSAIGNDIAVQSDGKILVGGLNTRGFHLTRLLPDSSLDSSFGTDGEALIPWPYDGDVLCILPLADGRIVAAGWRSLGTGRPPSVLARFLPNGALDLSFNQTGWVQWDFPDKRGASFHSLLLEDNGSILIAGTAYDFPLGFAMARILPYGLLDSSFGIGGRLVSYFEGSDYNECYSASLLPGGTSVLLTGRLRDPYRAVMARYLIGPEFRLFVEQPAGQLRPSGSATPPVDFGIVTEGTRLREFVIRNGGTNPLTGIHVAVSGGSAPGEFLASQPSSPVPPGGTTTFTVSFTPTASPVPRTAVLNVTSSGTGPQPYQIPVAGSKATPLQIWRLTWFGSLDNAGPGADANDFDRDGVPNLLEYALRTNPHQPSLSFIGTLTEAAGGGLFFTYSRDKASLAELSYQVETTVNPGFPWATVADPESIIADDGTTQLVRAWVPPPVTTTVQKRQFVRLRVTRR